MADSQTDIPLGYCQCGCGRKTNPARQTETRSGHIRGEPQRFVHGHRAKLSPDERRKRQRAYDGVRCRDPIRRDFAQLQKSRSRARRLGGEVVEDVHALVLLELDDGQCGICGGDVDPFDFEIDHVWPLSEGGNHSYANTQIAHAGCNTRKRRSVPE